MKLSVIHVNKHVVVFDFLVVFFCKKVRWVVRFPANETRVAFGLPYLLIELFYIGMPVVRTGARIVM